MPSFAIPKYFPSTAMNGPGPRRTPFSSDHDAEYSLNPNYHPSAKTMLASYDISPEKVNSGMPSQSRHDQTNAAYSRSSDQLDPTDPVSMHLLMETAIGDSQQYGVMSFEEADESKKEVSVLSTRIDATKRKLAIESKLRDASTSLNRLHSLENGNKTDDDLAATTRKCEDLTEELWKLEKRFQDLQRSLLEHTAGVLQMTHKGFLEEDPPAQHLSGVNGYAQGTQELSVLDVGGDFDDSSFYRTLDSLLQLDDGRSNGQIAGAFEQQTQTILEIERKIWDLNRRLRDSIAQATSGRQMLPPPPDADPDTADERSTDTKLQSQIGYLEKGLDTMQRSQIDTIQSYKQSAYAAEERLEDLNTQLHGMIVRSSKEPNPQYPLPPDISGKSPEEQISFLEGGLDTLEQRLQYLKDESQNSSSRSLTHEENSRHYESTLQNIWHGLINLEEKWRQDNSTDNERSVVANENFSLDSFATKVQTLQTRSAALQEQKDILARQIQQQREVNSKSDSEKDARLTELTTTLEEAKRDLESTSNDCAYQTNSFRDQLAASDEAKGQLLVELQDKHNAISRLESHLQTVLVDRENHATRAKVLQETIEAKSAESEKARNEMERFEGEMVRLQTELTVARAELDGAYGTRAQRAAEVASHPALLQEINDLKERNSVLEVVGSGNAELNQRVQTLQRELSETIAEYEIMTKASIEYEKEREHLENSIDGLRDRYEALELQLSDEKVKWLGVKSPGPPGSRESMGASNTSTSVLKNEFKKMMRETRAENMKALRYEQNERRKLEAQLRTMTRDQTPGKSSLSQSMTAQ